MRVLEVGKACYETQGSGPRVNEMRHGVVWFIEVTEIIAISRTKAYCGLHIAL